MNSSEILIEKYINSLGSSNQWLIITKSNQTTIINAFSLDEFLPYLFIQQNDGKQSKEFQMRQLYALPHTPKIILLPNKTNSQQQTLLLAQRGQFQFGKLISHCNSEQKSQLQLILQIISTLEMLQKKYGFFKLTNKMIRASKGPSLLVWINQDQANNHPQFPIGPIYPLNLENCFAKQKNNKNRDNPMHVMVSSVLKLVAQEFPNNAAIKSILQLEIENINFLQVKRRIIQFLHHQNGYEHPFALIHENDQLRRFTQLKKSKIPYFLLNKVTTNPKDKKKQFDCIKNKNSILITSNFTNQINLNLTSKDQIKNDLIYKKIECKFRENEQQKLFINKMIKNNDNLSKQQTAKPSSNCSEFHVPNLRFSIQPQNYLQLTKNEQTTLQFRQSGKTVSTSSAQFYSTKSSQNKIIENSFYPSSTPDRKLISSISSQNFRTQQHNRSLFFKEQTNKAAPKISKILEQNSQEYNRRGGASPQHSAKRTQKQQNILSSLLSNSRSVTIITQQSIASPDAQFYNDVDILLKSGVHGQIDEEFDKGIEEEFNKILCD